MYKMKDPFVEEIRNYRMKHTKENNYDIHAICDDLRDLQKKLCNNAEIDKDKKIPNKTLHLTSHSLGR
jgi:cell fate (sporulation/competence/biofilm development) regulator YmcA (YheA/YmcA/DUF963 family)